MKIFSQFTCYSWIFSWITFGITDLGGKGRRLHGFRNCWQGSHFVACPFETLTMTVFFSLDSQGISQTISVLLSRRDLFLINETKNARGFLRARSSLWTLGDKVLWSCYLGCTGATGGRRYRPGALVATTYSFFPHTRKRGGMHAGQHRCVTCIKIRTCEEWGHPRVTCCRESKEEGFQVQNARLSRRGGGS